MKNCLKHTILGLVLVWSLTTSRTPAGASLSAEPHYPRIVRAVTRMMPALHLYRMPVDEAALTERTIEIYLGALDFDRTYFMAADIDRFRAEGADLFQRLQDGDISWAFNVFDVFKQRVRDRVEQVEALIENGFDFDSSDSYRWKRRDAAWALDFDDWNDLWRRKTMHELLGRMVSARMGGGDSSLQEAALDLEFDEVTPETDEPDEAATSPEEFVRNRYRQYLMVLQDHEPEWVLQRFLSAFTQAFDPHSDYMSASTDEDFDINMRLSLEGIGAQLTSEDGAAKVMRIIPGGPADRDGRLQPGDKIIAVGQGREKPESVLHWSLTRTVRRIRGPKGSMVSLVVIPAIDKSGGTTIIIDLVRDEVRLEEQAARGERLDFEYASGAVRRLGVVSLPTFYMDMRGRHTDRDGYRSSTRDVRDQVAEMRAAGVEGIVLDLRANGGGSLTEAVEMTGLFLEAGPIVQVKERRGVQVLRDPDPAAIYDGPLVVLVSRLSASASEILAAALQDYGRAVIVGDSKTHGKGTVQSVVRLHQRDPLMGSLKVTAASFHRVNGKSTQQRGVIPDVVIPSTLETMEIGEEYLRHPIPWSQVDPVPFRPAGNLSTDLDKLRQNSSARIAAADWWQTQIQLLDRIRQVRESEEISLNLAERLRMAEAENSLRPESLRQRTAEPDDGLNLEKDIVMREALHILADWIAVANPPIDLDTAL